MTLGDYMRVFRRRKKIIIFIFGVCALGSIYWARSQKEFFAAEATIEIRKNLIAEGVGIRRAAVSNFEKQTLAKLAENKGVAEIAALKLRQSFPQSYQSFSDAELFAKVRNSVSVVLVGDANMLKIRAQGEKPVQITQISNAYADAVLLYHDLDRRKTVAGMLEYLGEQVRLYEAKMRELDNRVIEARESGKGPDGRPATTDVLARVASEVKQISDQQKAESLRLTALNEAAEAKNVSKLMEVIASPEIEFEKAELRRQRKEFEAAAGRFTDNHPTVGRLRDEIATGEKALLEKMMLLVNPEKERIQSSIDGLGVELDRKRTEEEMIRTAIADMPENRRQLSELERELAIASSVYHMFRQKKEDIDITLSTVPADQLLVRDYATVPHVAIGANRDFIVGMGFSVGFLLAVALAFLVESLDTSLIAMRDVERFIEKPILAVIPAIRIDPEKVRTSNLPMSKELLHKLPLLIDSRSPAAEAFRTLRAVLQSRFFKAGKKTLLVTSSTPQEGKTTTTINLAIACADAGMKTVLVGANMRHPVIGRYFRIDRSKGLNDVLSGKLEPSEAIQETGHENLSILDAGSFARRPAELLSQKEFDQLLGWLRNRYDAVIVDSPPTLPVADAATIAPKVDGVLIVYLASVAPRDALLRCKETLEEIGGNVIGIVFNDIRGASQDDYAGYYYHHKYAGDEFRRI